MATYLRIVVPDRGGMNPLGAYRYGPDVDVRCDDCHPQSTPTPPERLARLRRTLPDGARFAESPKFGTERAWVRRYGRTCEGCGRDA